MDCDLDDYVFDVLEAEKLGSEIFAFNKVMRRIHLMYDSVVEGERKGVSVKMVFSTVWLSLGYAGMAGNGCKADFLMKGQSYKNWLRYE